MLSLPEDISYVVKVSSESPLAMKNAVGIPFPGMAVGVVASGSAKLCLRERDVRASPPTAGRIFEGKLYCDRISWGFVRSGHIVTSS